MIFLKKARKEIERDFSQTIIGQRDDSDQIGISPKPVQVSVKEQVSQIPFISCPRYCRVSNLNVQRDYHTAMEKGMHCGMDDKKNLTKGIT